MNKELSSQFESQIDAVLEKCKSNMCRDFWAGIFYDVFGNNFFAGDGTSAIKYMFDNNVVTLAVFNANSLLLRQYDFTSVEFNDRFKILKKVEFTQELYDTAKNNLYSYSF
ncbi:MAG: hypothetical protein ACYCTB_10755 [bacterium]